MKIIRVLVANALLLAATAACSLPTGSSLEPLRLLLEVERETLSVGETVELRLSIRNVGGEAVRLTGSSSCPPFGFRIAGSTEQPLMYPGSPRICTADLRIWNVEPGGQIRHTFRWDGSVERGDGSMGPVAPGEYDLEPVVVGPPAAVRSGPPVRLVVLGG